MLMDEMEGISIIGGREEVTTGEEMGKGDRVGRSVLLGNGVCSGNQKRTCLERGQEVHPGIVTLDGKVVEDKEEEDRVAVEVNDEEFMI